MKFKATTLPEIAQELGNAFEEYKHINDERYTQLEQGINDPLVKQNLDNVVKAIGELEEIKETAEQALTLAKRQAIAGGALAANDHYKKQREEMIKFMRGVKGEQKSNRDFDALVHHEKSFSTGSDPNGGWLIRPYLDNTILQLLLETVSLRKYASILTIGTDFYEQLGSLDNQDVYWGDDITPTTDTQPNDYEKLRINVKNLRAAIPVPENLINDAYFDLESHIMQQAARKFGYGENSAFITGNGQKQPMGILSYPNGTTWGTFEQIPSGQAAAVSYDGLINLVYSLLEFYQANARFLINRTTIAEIRKLRYDTTSFTVPMWQPSLVAGQPSTLLGYPVVYAPEMPTFAANAKAIAFGDFSQGYLIVDRMGMTVLRDPFTREPQIVFKFKKRVGGGQRDYRAIKIQTISVS